MAGSIPASATADLAPAGLVAPGAGGGTHIAARVVRTPTGALGTAITALLIVLAIAGPALATTDPVLAVGPSLAPPSAAYWLGTDALGRDVLSGVLHGARTSLLVAGLVGLVAAVVGVTIGTLSGAGASWVDHVLMRLTEFFQVVPRFFLAVLALALFGPGLDRLVLVLGLTSWPIIARVARAETLSLRAHDFVRAAEAAGASRLQVITGELLPNLLPSILVVLGLLVGQVMLLEASLAFLGLGPPNAVSWGSLAGEGQPLLRVAWWVPLFPGLAIAVAVLGLNLLADAVTRVLRGD